MAKRRNGLKGKTRARRPETEWEPSPQQLQIYAEVCEGRGTQKLIAEKHGISRGRVSQLVKQVDTWLAPRWMESIREIKSQHTESLLHIFREAMAAWERSKLNEEREVTKQLQDSEGKLSNAYEKTKTVVGQCGNAAFLAEARAALEQIRQIWGANAPLKVEHSGELRVAGLTEEEVYQQWVSEADRLKTLMIPHVKQ